MSIEVEATYESGSFKITQPISLAEHSQVILTVRPKTSRFRELAEKFHWTGDIETLRKIAENDEILDEE